METKDNQADVYAGANPQELGRAIETLRRSEGVNRIKLAIRLGVNEGVIAALEYGTVRPSVVELLPKVLDHFAQVLENFDGTSQAAIKRAKGIRENPENGSFSGRGITGNNRAATLALKARKDRAER